MELYVHWWCINIKVLFVGDVCGSIGCDMLEKHLRKLKKENEIDFTVVNGENSADGNGITRNSAARLLNMGADVVTGGNHSFRREEMLSVYEENPYILRPHNLKQYDFGSGYCVVDKGRYRIAVINLSGRIYLERLEADNPFIEADALIERAKQDGAGVILVDFHAEATSEKRAMGFYLDGTVSVVVGTHTHVQTADSQILPKGTGYITDLGMTGPKQSVLGVKSDIIINRLRDNDMSKFELADGSCAINGCIFEIDEKTGKTLSVKSIMVE